MYIDGMAHHDVCVHVCGSRSSLSLLSPSASVSLPPSLLYSSRLSLAIPNSPLHNIKHGTA